MIDRLADSEGYVRDAAAESLGKLAAKAAENAKPELIKLVLPLARNKRKGEKNDDKREAGYVMLGNLLAAEVSSGGDV